MYDEMVGKDETWVDLNSRIDNCDSKMSIFFSWFLVEYFCRLNIFPGVEIFDFEFAVWIQNVAEFDLPQANRRGQP